jgi:hypothetical protein
MSDTIQLRSERIAGNMVTDGEKMGIDPLTILAIISIISKLIPIIQECFEPDDGPQIIEYINNRYNADEVDGDYRGYDRRMVRSTTRRTKSAARKDGKRITWDQAREIAIATLDDTRLSDPDELTMMINEDLMG